VGATDLPLSFTATVSGTAPWLTVTGGGATPRTGVLTANPSGVTPGSYHAAVVINANGAPNKPLVIPVDMTVTTGAGLPAAPSALLFTPGAAQSQTLRITSSGPPVSFTISSSEPWITAAASGVTPQDIQVSVNPSSLSPGAHQGSLLIKA